MVNDEEVIKNHFLIKGFPVNMTVMHTAISCRTTDTLYGRNNIASHTDLQFLVCFRNPPCLNNTKKPGKRW